MARAFVSVYTCFALRILCFHRSTFTCAALLACSNRCLLALTGGADLPRLSGSCACMRVSVCARARDNFVILQVGDVVTAINSTKISALPARFDISGLVLGEPFSRVSLEIKRDGHSRCVHMVLPLKLFCLKGASP